MVGWSTKTRTVFRVYSLSSSIPKNLNKNLLRPLFLLRRKKFCRKCLLLRAARLLKCRYLLTGTGSSTSIFRATSGSRANSVKSIWAMMAGRCCLISTHWPGVRPKVNKWSRLSTGRLSILRIRTRMPGGMSASVIWPLYKRSQKFILFLLVSLSSNTE